MNKPTFEFEGNLEQFKKFLELTFRQPELLIFKAVGTGMIPNQTVLKIVALVRESQGKRVELPEHILTENVVLFLNESKSYDSLNKIKLLRDKTGCSLKVAKEIVDNHLK